MRPQKNEPCVTCKYWNNRTGCEVGRYNSASMTIFGACGFHKTKTREYRLKYIYGAWVTHAKFYAETDAEAIFDASEEFEKSGLPGWPYDVALFCGRRRVKTFKGVGA